MTHSQPEILYRNPNADKKDSIITYIGNRVNRYNQNFICALTGKTGSGKSWLGLAICEKYSKQFNIQFIPRLHIIDNLKQLLLLINNKEFTGSLKIGSILLFEEPQVAHNARNWRAESNQILSTIISTFRNQRLVVLFTVPFLTFIDKQSRILFHAEFKSLGFDQNTKITTVKPRFLDYQPRIDDFYTPRLIVRYAIEGKSTLAVRKLNKWLVEKPSDELIVEYETFKKQMTDEINKKLLEKIIKSEMEEESLDKNREFFKVVELYNKYGENYIKILTEMPFIKPSMLDLYVKMIKKSSKESNNKSL